MNPKENSIPIFHCPLHTNPLSFTAQVILETYNNQLPNLANLTLLLPNAAAIPDLRKALLKTANTQQCEAILGPDISTLELWLKRYCPHSNNLISSEFSLALLVSEIRKFKWLYGNNNPWYFAEELLTLFNDLSYNRIQLPNQKDQFVQFLTEAYGASNENVKIFSREAELVHTLWEAWQQQLPALGLQDHASLYSQMLSESVSKLSNDASIWLIGFNQLLPIEEEWLAKLQQKKQVYMVRYGYSDNEQNQSSLNLIDCINPSDLNRAQTSFFQHCFDYRSKPVIERIQQYQTQGHSKPDIPIRLLPLDSAEKHALSIYTCIKQALSKNHKTVGIITEDRRLARRVRALMERDGLPLKDISGWALSTTHASTVIENWLQCVEEDFPFRAFLDLLKSNFMNPLDDRNQYLYLIHRFEQDIVLHENISSGIDRYIAAVKRRRKILGNWAANSSETLLKLLNSFKESSKQLSAQVLTDDQSLKEIASHIRNSLEQLNLDKSLYGDPAGKLLLELFDNIINDSNKIPGEFSWFDFRTWYGRIQESRFFSPNPNRSPISIVNLEQSYMLEFDTVIFAAADANHFPNKSGHHAFFNERVRSALKIKSRKDKIDYSAFIFRALLERNKNIIVTWQARNKDEPIPVSPWVEAIENFHSACFEKSLVDQDTLNLVNHFSQTVQEQTRTELETQSKQPRPQISNELIPSKLSVSAYQRIINCPYQFYANDVLSLKPSDEIKETLQKSDFGNRIHQCLHAFFTDEKGLPGPFKLTINEENKQAAIDMLTQISKHIFSKDIEDNFQHRSWLNKWLSTIPSFIEHEIKRQQRWKNKATESTTEHNFATVQLYGRIDRIDTERENNSLSIIDYKTGSMPKLNEIESGEDIQLSSYALMMENVSRIEYIQIESNTSIRSNCIESEQLPSLQHELRKRTEEIFTMIDQGHHLPAWPDEGTCSYCHFIGLCRFPNWKRSLRSD